jgi:hypothetical protein
MSRRALVLLAALALGCSALRGAEWPRPTKPVVTGHALTPSPAASPAAGASCPESPRPIGRIQSQELDEISGVVESHFDPRVLFVHNDSGDTARFFAIDRSGELLAELTLGTVPLLLDAEDIAIGPGPGGAAFVYLGDTGNNFATGLGIPRRKAVVYRIPEPHIVATARGLKVQVDEAFPIVFTFPRGIRNVEAFFVDPRSGELVMIAKQPDGVSEVLLASAALLENGGGELALAGQLQFGASPLPGNPMPTSASISRDGSAILVRTYSSVFLFRRGPSDTVMQALQRPPRVLPSPAEGQGEAITFADGDQSYLTISEGVRRPIHCAHVPAEP